MIKEIRNRYLYINHFLPVPSFLTGLCVICFFLSPSTVFSQNKIDSLRRVITTAQEDTTKISALNALSYEYINTANYDTALALANEALQLATVIMRESNPSLRPGAERRGSNLIYQTVQKGMAYSYNNIGIIHKEQGNYPEALQWYAKLLKLVPSGSEGTLEWKKMAGNAYNNIGNIHDDQGNYPEALQWYAKALQIREEIGDKKGMASSYNNIGSIHKEQGNYPEALQWYAKSLKIKEEIGDKRGGAVSYNNIGLLFSSLYENDSTKESTIELLDSAEYYHRRAHELAEEIGSKHDVAFSLNGLGAVMLLRREYAKARHYHEEALRAAKEINEPIPEQDAQSGLAQAWRGLGSSSKGVAHYLAYLSLRDTLQSEESKKVLGRFEEGYRLVEADRQMKAKEAEEARKQAEYIRERNFNQLTALASSVLCFVLLAFAVLRLAYRSSFWLRRYGFAGRLRPMHRVSTLAIFFSLLSVFQLILVWLDPYIDAIAEDNPIYKVGLGMAITLLFFPLKPLLQRLLSTKNQRSTNLYENTNYEKGNETGKGMNFLMFLLLFGVSVFHSCNHENENASRLSRDQNELTPNAKPKTQNEITQNAERRTQNAKRKTQNVRFSNKSIPRYL